MTEDRSTERISERVKMNEQGRIVIPAAIRSALGFVSGQNLVLRVENGELRIATPLKLVDDMAERLKPFRPAPGEPLVSDELIAERRRDAAREEASAQDWERRHADGV